MSAQRKVRLFRNGRNQAVRIPREFELPGTDAVMRREGERLIIESAQPAGPNAGLLAVLSTLEPAPDADVSDLSDPPAEPVRL